MCLIGAAPAPGAPGVVISQVYGGGGELFGFPNADYVELFNRGDQAQDVSGWSVQVSQGSDLAPWSVIPISGTIAPGQFFLVRVFTPAPGGGGVALPTPDAAGSSPSPSLLLAGDGRAAVVRSSTPLNNTPCPALAAVVADFVAWGPAYACAEGTAAPEIDAASALFRAQGGCRDSSNNDFDFIVDAPNPRNSADNGYIQTAANPGNPLQGSALTILVALDPLAPCSANFGSIVGATADLTAIGGPPDLLLDDAGGDDDEAGDGLFGGTVIVGAAAPPGTYRIPVTVNNGEDNLIATEAVAVTIRPAAPPNDYCPGAIDVGPLNVPFTATVDNSTAEVDTSPICGSAPRPFGVWYRFTPGADGVLRLTETGPQDVTFSVYQTASCILSVAGGLAMCSGADDLTTASVIGGETYAILVSSTDPPAPGPLELRFSFVPRPVNDECIGAIDLGPLSSPYSAIVDNSAALSDIDVNCNAGAVTRFGVWYTFVPPAPGALIMSETSAQDAVFGVFTGPCAGLVPVASGSCFSADTGSTATPLAAGTRYFILLGNQTSSTTPPSTPFALTLTFAPFPTNDTCSAARTVAQFPFDDYPYAPQAGDDPDVLCNSAGNVVTRRGVWYRLPPALGPGRLVMTETSVNDVVFAMFEGGSCSPLGAQTCMNEATAAAGFTLPGGQEYRLLVGLNSSTVLPSLPYSIHIEFDTLTGACCLGSTCLSVTGVDCVAAGGTYAGLHSACNVLGVNNSVPCCYADYNHSGEITVQDIFDYLAAFAIGDISADTNRSGAVSVQDIFDFIAAWFVGCV